ncbi:hypothetical protein H2198_008385 [Neophaeococcomyces mojaviensis]|uniref:Uncharacterized protein n=1 Tax=Neophaeococcomyces mojaviensis TaxID=3383035 RepID=A0ACC2ZX92_9EURO|nr:hypothetical protein H2198_008385 [Knufia sp. JES_112]
MAFIQALCRIRVKDSSMNSAPFHMLSDCPRVTPQLRLSWAKAIEENTHFHAQSDHQRSIRDWDLVLGLDGSVENVAEIQHTASPSASLSATEAEQKKYPAHYQIPSPVTDHLDPGSETATRTELFALGSLLYELQASRKPFHDRSDQEVQSLYAEGSFPDDVWRLPGAFKILCCWCPEFTIGLQDPSARRSFLSRSGRYIKNHPVSFSLQVLGGIASIASIAVLPVLGAVGFAAAGPVAGTAAAGWQASIGLVQAGSLFAWCQSAAMGGAAVGGIVATGAAGGAVAAGATAAGRLGSGNDDNTDDSIERLQEVFRASWQRQIDGVAMGQEGEHSNNTNL